MEMVLGLELKWWWLSLRHPVRCNGREDPDNAVGELELEVMLVVRFKERKILDQPWSMIPEESWVFRCTSFSLTNVTHSTASFTTLNHHTHFQSKIQSSHRQYVYWCLIPFHSRPLLLHLIGRDWMNSDESIGTVCLELRGIRLSVNDIRATHTNWDLCGVSLCSDPETCCQI